MAILDQALVEATETKQQWKIDSLKYRFRVAWNSVLDRLRIDEKESNSLSWAKDELARIGMGPEATDINKMMRDDILEIMRKFSEQGHSGFSAAYAISILEKLLRHKPLSPLTGEDDEWVEVSSAIGGRSGVYQNKRFSAVFKENGVAEWIDGVVFWEWYKDSNGEMHKSFFTGRDSRVKIEFPFVVPEKPEYRFRPSEEFPNETI